MNSAEEIPTDFTFPMYQLLPKKETGIQDFLTKYPKYDGAGVVIAILDTGVDPAAPGLQITTSNKPKIIDIINCSGAGDVDTSTVKSLDDDGNVIGLTGRKLKFPHSWNNPTNKVHLGIKDFFDLYPKNLKDRIKKERREKLWDSLQRLAVADATRQIEAFEKEHGLNPEALEDKWQKEDLNALADVLKGLDKDYNDCGPVVDCVVFHDGKTWKVCIDTSYRGVLEKCKLLSSYRENHEYVQFSTDDMFTYSVNVHQNGNLLEIASTSGSHGTHVASIAAANFPDDPSKNGIAPGAQVLALVIGDNRLDSMETGAALTRAINKCIELNVDIINYSYGESTHWVETGRIVSAIEEAVFKHNIVFISSAGNNGPCLSTVSCPGGTLSACIGVGAYLTPEMMSTMYSLREKLPPTLYPWSARGPTVDGDLGVCISAPGGAITSVPNWTLKRCQLQNGTSMSSPNVAGAVACIVSALKSEKIYYTPFSIQRGLQNTAKKTEKHDYFSIGYGLIQAEECFNYIRANHSLLDSNVRYKIVVDNKYRGVYLRELHQLQRPREILIAVEPAFKENVDNSEKVNFEKHFVLTCKAAWVEIPMHFELTNQQRQFNIKIDPRNFEKNTVNYAEVLAFDAQNVDMGPLWRLPITVIIPDVVQDTVRNSITIDKIFCKPSIVYRHFIHVPERADWAVLKFQSFDEEKFSRFVFHAVQLLPNKSYRSTESYKVVTLSENGETTQSFHVWGGKTLELCIVKWWSSLGDVYAKFELTFHGITPMSQEITMLSTDGVLRLDMASKLSYEEASPCVTLRYLCQPLRPSEAKISALGPRDLFQDGRQIYQLLLTYNFSVAKSCEVTPTFCHLSDYLYENEYDCQLWMVFTQNRQFMFAGEAYPSRYSGKLEKGDYVLILQLRHEDKEMLERTKDLNAVVQYKLQNPVNLDCYPSWSSAVTPSGKKFGTSVVALGSTVPLYFTTIPDDKLPKPCGSGWFLSGHLTLPKDEIGKRVSQYNFTYVIVDLPKKTKPSTDSASSESGKGEKTVKQKFEEALRDLKINWINRLDVETSGKLFSDVKSSYEDHLPLYLAKLKFFVEKGVAKNRDAIIEMADEIINKIDRTVLLQYFGAKSDLSVEAASVKTEMDKKKQSLIEALVTKGGAIADFVLNRMPDAPLCFQKGAMVRLPPTPKRQNASPSANQTSTGNENAEENDFQIVEEQNANVKEVTASDTEPKPNVDDDDGDDEDQTSSIFASSEQKTYSKKDVNDIFVELMKFVEANDPKVVLFSIKHAVVHGHYGRALTYLKKALDDKPSKELESMAIEIYEQLGWVHVANYFRNWLFVKYPQSYRLF